MPSVYTVLVVLILGFLLIYGIFVWMYVRQKHKDINRSDDQAALLKADWAVIRLKAQMCTLKSVITKLGDSLASKEALAKKHLDDKLYERAKVASAGAERTRKKIQHLEAIYTKMAALVRELDLISEKIRIKAEIETLEADASLLPLDIAEDVLNDIGPAIDRLTATSQELLDHKR